MTETKTCEKCGGTKYHNEGTSKKTGKPYENWKCGKCQDVEWVSKQNHYEKPDIPDENFETLLASDRLTRRSIEALAMKMDINIKEAIEELDARK